MDASAAQADAKSEPVDANRRTVLPMDLRAGDCIADPAGGSLPEEAVTVLAVDVVDCETPHEEEVIARLAHPAGRQADFPGDDALIEHADAACLDEFEGWVGRPYAESALAAGLRVAAVQGLGPR